MSHHLKNQTNFDGKREGYNGWWISAQDAIEVAGEAWWELEPCRKFGVELKQYDEKGPSERPIWMWCSGSMYLGHWKIGNDEKPTRHGIGVYYSHLLQDRGRIRACNWERGFMHGDGESFWLDSAPFWKKNKWDNSVLRSSVYVLRSCGSGGHGIPYCYKGKFRYGKRNDDEAVVTLKDGTTRIGPWKDNKPVGGWHTTHRLLKNSPGISSKSRTDDSVASSNEERHAATMSNGGEQLQIFQEHAGTGVMPTQPVSTPPRYPATSKVDTTSANTIVPVVASAKKGDSQSKPVSKLSGDSELGEESEEEEGGGGRRGPLTEQEFDEAIQAIVSLLGGGKHELLMKAASKIFPKNKSFKDWAKKIIGRYEQIADSQVRPRQYDNLAFHQVTAIQQIDNVVLSIAMNSDYEKKFKILEANLNRRIKKVAEVVEEVEVKVKGLIKGLDLRENDVAEDGIEAADALARTVSQKKKEDFNDSLVEAMYPTDATGKPPAAKKSSTVTTKKRAVDTSSAEDSRGAVPAKKKARGETKGAASNIASSNRAHPPTDRVGTNEVESRTKANGPWARLWARHLGSSSEATDGITEGTTDETEGTSDNRRLVALEARIVALENQRQGILQKKSTTENK